MQQRQKILEYLAAAFEMTIYLAPNDLWLSSEELFEAMQRAGFMDGEVVEVLPQIANQSFGVRSKLSPHLTHRWHLYTGREDPDFNNYNALDFVISELNTEYRKFGSRNAMDRSVLIERANTAGHLKAPVEAAIGMLALMGTVTINSDRLTLRAYHDELPSSVMAKFSPPARVSEARQKMHGIIRDIVARRGDGRAKHSEALDAFTEVLDRLGYKPFRLWWTQTLGEFRRTDAIGSPLSKLVLAAALVEAALTFVVTHARSLKVGPFESSTFGEPPQRWKIDDLVKSASMGQEKAIFESAMRIRIEQLIKMRQRIHAGRMLAEYPRGVPDLKPEEARESQQVAELAVRNILDWLQRYAPLQ